MTEPQMLNREVEPTEDYIRKLIGKETLPIWEATQKYLLEKYPRATAEMVYYSPQRGWGMRYRDKSQQLCILFPGRGGFNVLIILNPEEEQVVLKKVHYFNGRIRALLNQPSSLPHGRWLWARIEDHTDFFSFKLLINAKAMKF